MGNKLLFTACCAMALAFASCGGRGDGPAGRLGAEFATTALRKLEIPEPPAMMTEPGDRAAFLAAHYWDNFDFGDTTWIVDTAGLETHFATYLSVIDMLERPEAAKAMSGLMRRAEAERSVYMRFADMAEHYLYGGDSPMRDDDLYLSVLKDVVASDRIGEIEKERPLYQLRRAMRNRPGDKASDLPLELPGGGRMSLYDVKAPYVILFFIDPGCHQCAEITGEMIVSPVVAPMVSSGKAKIVTVYMGDDGAAWRQYVNTLPAGWVHGWDSIQRIDHEGLYDIRSLPVLYLLDGNKRVILKETGFVQMENRLDGIM